MKAQNVSNAEAESLAAAASIALGPGASFAGAGANSDNTVNNDVEAYIEGSSALSKSSVTAASGVAVTAYENGDYDSEVGSGAIAIGLAGASIGVSTSKNTDTSTVKATVDNVSINAASFELSATGFDLVTAETIATSLALAIGGAGAGGDASSSVTPNYQVVVGSGATVVTTTGDIDLEAKATREAAASLLAIAGGVVAIGISTTETTIGGDTSVTVAGGASLTSGAAMTIAASSIESTNSQAGAIASSGIVGYGGSTATSTTNETTGVSIGDVSGSTTPVATTLMASGNIEILSYSNTATASATATNDALSLGFTDGSPTANLTITDPSTATLGASVGVTSTLGNISIDAATDDASVKSNATGQGGSLVADFSATSTTSVTDHATTEIGKKSTLTANLGTILVQSMTTADANATANGNSGGAFDASSATATTTVDAPALTQVDDGATLSAEVVQINAQGYKAPRRAASSPRRLQRPARRSRARRRLAGESPSRTPRPRP